MNVTIVNNRVIIDGEDYTGMKEENDELRSQLAEAQQNINAPINDELFTQLNQKIDECDQLKKWLAEAQRECALYRKQGISLLNDYEERVKERDAALERCKRLEEALREAETQCTQAIRILQYDEGVQAIDQEIRPIIRAALAAREGGE